MDSVDLLLPNFQGRELQARVLNTKLGSTTYLVTCHGSMAAEECGVLGSGMTVLKSPTFVQVINFDNDDKTASVSCAIEGTTYASCHAKETITVQGTLASKDLNWMPIPLTGTPFTLPTHSPSLAEVSGLGSNEILPQGSEAGFSFGYHFLFLSKLTSLSLAFFMALYFFVHDI